MIHYVDISMHDYINTNSATKSLTAHNTPASNVFASNCKNYHQPICLIHLMRQAKKSSGKLCFLSSSMQEQLMTAPSKHSIQLHDTLQLQQNLLSNGLFDFWTILPSILILLSSSGQAVWFSKCTMMIPSLLNHMHQAVPLGISSAMIINMTANCSTLMVQSS